MPSLTTQLFIILGDASVRALLTLTSNQIENTSTHCLFQVRFCLEQLHSKPPRTQIYEDRMTLKGIEHNFHVENVNYVKLVFHLVT